MFRIIVEEITVSDKSEVGLGSEQAIKRFEQTVDVLDLPKLIDVINAKPRKIRERKAKGAA